MKIAFKAPAALLLLAFACLSSACDRVSGYESNAAFSIELTDHETGMPVHGTMQQLDPIIAREAGLVTNETTLRHALNAHVVLATSWFAQFNGDKEAALVDLERRIRTERNEGEPTFTVYATFDSPEDCIIILDAVVNEYLMEYESRRELELDRRRGSVHIAYETAQQRVAEALVAIEQYLLQADQPGGNGDPVDTGEARFDEIMLESLRDELSNAEAQREIERQRADQAREWVHLKASFLGYRVTEDLPPTLAR